MINYKLAKQLKDAGLRLPPGTNRKGYTLLPNGKTTTDDYDYESESWNFEGEHYYIPTLSELIDACDNKQFRLQRWNAGLTWLASVPHETERSLIMGEDEEKESAVAKLYLALNKK